jgi:hypothetical protein
MPKLLPKPRFGRKTFYSISSVVLLSCVAVGVLAVAFLVDVPPSISPDTTVLTEPRTPDGQSVDYRALFLKTQDETLGAPTQNGFRDVLNAFGPLALEAGIAKPTPPWADFLRKQSARQKAEYAFHCEKFGLDPTAEPAFWSRPELLDVFRLSVDADAESPLAFLTEETWTPEELPLVDAWIRQHADLFALLETAIDRETFAPYLFPQDELFGMFGKNNFAFKFCKNLALALKTRALYRVATGDVDGALDDSRLILRLGRSLLNVETNAFNENFAALSVLRRGTELAEATLAAVRENPESAARLAAIFDETLGDFDYAAAVERGIRNERVFEFLPFLVDMLAATSPAREEAFLFLGSLRGDDVLPLQLLDETTVAVSTRALDGDAFLSRFNLFWEAALEDDFDYRTSKFAGALDSPSLLSPSRKARSRAWADVVGALAGPPFQGFRGAFEETRLKVTELRAAASQAAVAQAQPETAPPAPATTP